MLRKSKNNIDHPLETDGRTPTRTTEHGKRLVQSVLQLANAFVIRTVVAPMEASVTVLFENEGKHGAVLTTESPVTRHTIGNEKSAVQWMVDNKSEMLRQHGDVFKRHGIWIVTKTYSTRRSAVAVMTSKSSTVEIGLGVDAQGILTLTPKSTWTRSTGSFCTEIHDDDEEGVVVFISGIYFSPRFLSMGMSQTREQRKQEGKFLRADGRAGSKDGEEAVELEIEFFPPLDEDED